ncbi:hypothetical protein D3C83_103750 [compost metagenome]
MFLRDTDTGILDLKNKGFSIVSRAKSHGPVFRELRGIAQQIQEHLLNAQAIGN